MGSQQPVHWSNVPVISMTKLRKENDILTRLV